MKIKIIFFCFPILFFACEKKIRIDKKTLTEVNNILEKSIESQLGRFNKIQQNLKDDMLEPKKHKYNFLFLAAYETIVKYENFAVSFQESSDSLNLLLAKSDLKIRENFIKKSFEKLNNIDLSMINTFDSLLNKNYKIIGLRHNEMIKRIEGIHKSYSDLQNTLIPKLTDDITRNDVLNIKLKFIKYAAIHKAHFFIDKFRELAGGKVFCGPHYIFPLVQPQKNSVKKGDDFEAKIFVGNGYEFHPLDQPKIIVNRDTLEFDKEKEFAIYKVRTKKRGEEKLNIEFMMVNKLTGEKYTTSSEYIIKVN